MTHALDTGSDPVSAETVRAWRRDLGGLRVDDDVARCELLRALEELKAAASAAQALITVELDRTQRREQESVGARGRDIGRGVAAQVALARRESPTMGARHLGLAHALVEELPRTLRALQRGDSTEWRATVIARETACLSRRDRTAVDRELSLRPGGLAAMGDRAVMVETRKIVYCVDGQAFTRRAAKAEADRRVTLRPAPDTMTLLSGLLPVRQGVAVFASLTRHADSLRSTGDRRSRGQIMADTLFERVTGLASADAVPLEVNLVMTDRALLSADPESNRSPAHVEGYGPVPAALGRSWLRDGDADVWVRRLYTDPDTGSLVAMDSRRRTFSGGLRRFVVVRDEVCRTPWCGAPIRHVDHPRRVADGGATSACNAQGLCEACNLAKEAPGWRAWTSGDVIETQTPTGHRFVSRPPSLAPRPLALLASRASPASRVECFFSDLVLIA